jgi:benzoylformate decarboxylase
LTRIAGKHALLKMFEAEGVEYMFGNPGTSEAPMMAVMDQYPSINYVLVLQEGVAVGLAEGYARSTGKVPLVSLHIDNGMSNGLSLMIDQLYSGTPMVMTAGNKDIRKLAPGRSDLADMARPYAKWSTEITHAEQVPSVIRRAFQEARTVPTGPVFVAMSANAFDDEADVDLIPSAQVDISPSADPQTIEEICGLIASASRPILIVGDRVAESNGTSAAVAVAEAGGMRAYGHGSAEVNFPADHPLWQGNLSMRASEAVAAVRSADVIVAVGCPVFEDFFHQPGQFVAASSKLVHIDINPGAIGKSEPTDIGVVASPGKALGQLAEALSAGMNGTQSEAAAGRSREAAGESAARVEEFRKLVAASPGRGRPMSPAIMVDRLASALPDNAAVFNDSVSTSGVLFEALAPSTQNTYYGCRGQAIGWGMGAAMGVKLGSPDQPVVGVIGDGSAIITVQALWTAVNSKIPAVFVICNNASYRVLKVNMNHYHRLNSLAQPDSYFAMDFPNPIDFAAQAQAYGMSGVRVDDPDDIDAAINSAIDSGEPAVIDMIIDGSL